MSEAMKKWRLKGGAMFEGWECAGLDGLPFEPENSRPLGQPEERSSILEPPVRPKSPLSYNLRRTTYYQPAFEDYMRRRGWPYVAVDEAKKAIFTGSTLKSFHYLVYSSIGDNLLAHVCGRLAHGTLGQNWLHSEDVDGLTEWGKVFGQGFAPTLIFAYRLVGEQPKAEDEHLFREGRYVFCAVRLVDYVAAATVRNEKWGTIAVQPSELRRIALPIDAFL